MANAERRSRGIATLRSNGALTQSAGGYAMTLLGFASLTHTANGTTLTGRVGAAGYGGGFLGEVLWQGRGAFAPADVVAGWMNSPPHLDIILDPNYRDAGVGCAFRGGGSSQEIRCAMDVGA
ncbi:MAG: CAP domain-containing protein [Dehalococcoidia bacterium]